MFLNFSKIIALCAVVSFAGEMRLEQFQSTYFGAPSPKAHQASDDIGQKELLVSEKFSASNIELQTVVAYRYGLNSKNRISSIDFDQEEKTQRFSKNIRTLILNPHEKESVELGISFNYVRIFSLNGEFVKEVELESSRIFMMNELNLQNQMFIFQFLKVGEK